MRTHSQVTTAIGGMSILVATALPAAAHVGHGETDGLVHGFVHPMTGMDHMLATVSVGLLAAFIGGRALWIVPAAFLAMMAVGAALAMTGMSVPYFELGISLSVIVLGAALALQLPLPVFAVAIVVGFLATFHGFAHGAEMPVDASGASYATGFLFATAVLHIIGIAAGATTKRWISGSNFVSRLIGGGIAIAGVALTAAS